MIASLPRPPWLRAATALYLAAFLLFLFVPLVVVALFAFNNAPYPAPPWHGSRSTGSWATKPRAGSGCFVIRSCSAA